MAEKSLCSRVSELIAERDSLRLKLRYSQSTIEELQRQNRNLDLLLSNAGCLIQKHIPGMNAVSEVATSEPNGAQTTWIGGSWLETGLPELASAERAWQVGNKQEALSDVLQLISRNLTTPLSIEAGLLLSALLRTSGNPEQALIYAQESLLLAKNSREVDQDLLGKAHFHAGLCYLYLARYTNASWCLALAKSAKGYELEVEVNWELAEENRLKYESDSRQMVSGSCLN